MREKRIFCLFELDGCLFQMLGVDIFRHHHNPMDKWESFKQEYWNVCTRFIIYFFQFISCNVA